jgi:hypothetical protein
MENWLRSVDWTTYLAAVISSGIVTFCLDLILKRGKIKLDHREVEIRYKITDGEKMNYITEIKLLLRFINTSGHVKIIKNIQMQLFDGDKWYELEFYNEKLPPSFSVDVKSVVDKEYTLVTIDEDLTVPMLAIHDNEAYMKLTYLKGKKKVSDKIMGSELILTNTGFAAF